jgi:beta-glucosidase-like glycosyl hydrolase
MFSGIDEVPFQAAIAAGVKLVMVSWAVYPALGARPAGLSPNVVQGELRDRLHLTGVTITDALQPPQDEEDHLRVRHTRAAAECLPGGS